MPSITRKITPEEQIIITATEEIIIISGTLTNISIGDILISLWVTRGIQKNYLINEMLLPGTNYPPIIREPKNICTKCLLGAGDKLSATVRAANQTNWWTEATNTTELGGNWQSVLYTLYDGLAVVNLGYFPMED